MKSEEDLKKEYERIKNLFLAVSENLKDFSDKERFAGLIKAYGLTNKLVILSLILDKPSSNAFLSQQKELEKELITLARSKLR